VTLLIGFAAVNTGNNLLFLIVSALLAFMAVSGIAGWRNIRGLSMGLDLPDEIYAGLPTLVTIRLRNHKRLLPSFLLHATIFGKTVTTYLLGREREETDSFIHSFTGRGRHSFPRMEIRSPFPVNFFVRYRKISLGGDFPVFPSPLSCKASADSESPVKRGDSSVIVKGADGEFSRVADYTGKEPMKLIHWRLSAKFDELKVRELSATAGEPLVIDIDTLPGIDLEERLSKACFLINRLMGQNRPVGLKLGETTIGPALSRRHRLDLLTELALYGKD
jgi:uncharacterized protein (DUF58 family)